MSFLDSITGYINQSGLTGIQRYFPKTFAGAQINQSSSVPEVNFFNKTGSQLTEDHRVRIQVPTSYVSGIYTNGGNKTITDNLLTRQQGIVFPYSPQIQLEHKADYTSAPVTHSNFQQHFYQRSNVGNITVTGQYSVQNDADAEIYLSTVHLLRSLTKMLTGADVNAGSPPPVCRFFAYGPYMFKNVPVAISSFRADLPEKIDYFTVSSDSIFKNTMVPTLSSITVTLIPMYSRREQRDFTVGGWLSGNLNKAGYL